MSTEISLLFAIISGIALLLILIIKVRLNAFLSLLIASIWIGLFGGIPPEEISNTISKGMGDTLAFVATIVGLGTIFGAILEHSGGARQISTFLVKKTGEKKARIAMLFSGFIVAIPVFFDVAFIILFPVVQALSKKLGKPILFLALPLLTGIGLTHSFIPPTPGPVAVADILKVDLGYMIGIGVIVTIPVAIICGIIISRKLVFSTSIDLEIKESKPIESIDNSTDLVQITHFAILLPLLLMVTNAVLKTIVTEGIIDVFPGYQYLILIGHPFSALLLATLFAIYFLGKKAGLDKEKLFKISNDSLAPAGTIILITGAGGVLKETLISTGIGTMIAQQMGQSSSSILLLAFGVASIVRILQGSATIAMITGAGIVAPIISILPDFSAVESTLIALSIAAGSITVSHVNDSGFWIVNRFLKQEVTETLKSWTILSTAVSVTSFLVILIINAFI